MNHLKPKPFIVGEYAEHEPGDKDCGDCWKMYPLPCDCGGLVHAAFFEEMQDGYLLSYACDRCDDPCPEVDEND